MTGSSSTTRTRDAGRWSTLNPHFEPVYREVRKRQDPMGYRRLESSRTSRVDLPYTPYDAILRQLAGGEYRLSMRLQINSIAFKPAETMLSRIRPAIDGIRTKG
jgi:hypothetical protein